MENTGPKRSKRSWLGRWRSKGKEAAPANDTTQSLAEATKSSLRQNDPLLSETKQPTIEQNQPKPTIVEDLWHAAYQSLGEDEKSRLDSIPGDLLQGSHNDHSAVKPPISTVLEDVIVTVETQFKVRKMKNDTSRVRKAAKGILDTAYSMQSFIGSIAAADPTGHAATAWAVVSLGLKVSNLPSVYLYLALCLLLYNNLVGPERFCASRRAVCDL